MELQALLNIVAAFTIVIAIFGMVWWLNEKKGC